MNFGDDLDVAEPVALLGGKLLVVDRRELRLIAVDIAVEFVEVVVLFME